MVTSRRLAVVGSLAIAGGILVVAPSCGSGFLEGLSGGKRDTGVETETGAVDAGVDARLCDPRVPPPPPPDTEEGSGPDTITLAMDAFRIDNARERDASIPPALGFDIDTSCTCPEVESCLPPPDSGTGKKCDDDGGTDNSLGRLFATLGGIRPDAFGPDFATDAIRGGKYGALMAIADWNRQPNDRKVYVSFFLSAGTEPDVDGGSTVAKLDGTDVWSVDPESIENGNDNIGADCTKEIIKCPPRYITREAYVTNNFLVARIDVPLAISASSGRIVIEMKDVFFVGKLRQENDIWKIDGEFVGRWPVERVLKALGKIEVDGTPLCDPKQKVLFDVAKVDVCDGVDVMSGPADDHTGKRCDALSAAFRFSGTSAKLGHIYKPDIPPPACESFAPTCAP